MGRPKGTTGRRQLTTEERQRVRTLYFDAKISQNEIQRITTYTPAQIRTAIRAKSAAIKPRSGRPRKKPEEKTTKEKVKKETTQTAELTETPELGDATLFDTPEFTQTMTQTIAQGSARK